MERTVPFLNGCISFVAFVTAATLVVYMLVVIVTGTIDVSNTIYQTIFMDPLERTKTFNYLNADFLHNVAVLLILMKAYRVLVEYMRHHHIDIKFMVEITIIASVLELLFNFRNYEMQMLYVLGGLAISFLGFYVLGYKQLKTSSTDAQKESQKYRAKKQS